jgi:hypothetical protein
MPRPGRFRALISVLATATVCTLSLFANAVFATGAQAALGEFETLAPSPADVTSVTPDPNTGLIYSQQNEGNNFYRYDPRTNEWTELAAAPINSGNNGGAAYLNGKIYTAYTEDSETLGVYDIATNTWTTISNPLERGTADITSVGGELYLAAGRAFVKYNPATETTTPLAEAPSFHEELWCGNGFEPWGGLAPYHGKIYGHEGNGCKGFAVYDLETNTWEELPELPEGGVAGSALDPVSATYFAEGSYGGGNFYRYDIASKSWSTITLPFSAGDTGMAYLALPGLTGIYVAAGEQGVEFSRYSTPEPAPEPTTTTTATTTTASTHAVITAVTTTSAKSAAAPRASIHTTGVDRSVAGGKAKIGLACTGATCSGRLSLAWLHRAGKRVKTMLLSRILYTLQAGHGKSFIVTLTKEARNLFLRNKGHQLVVRVRATTKQGEIVRNFVPLALK